MSNVGLSGGKAERLVLAGPFGRQVAESGDSHAPWKPPLDGGSYKIGREERKRDGHVDLPQAASLALCDAFHICFCVSD